MKYPLLVLLSFLFVQLAVAQDRSDERNAFGISPAFELRIPNQSVYSIGVGGSLKFEIPLVHKFSLTATGGITSMDYKSALVKNFGTPGSDTFIPLKGGVKYYSSTGFYLEAEAGSTIQTTNDKRSLFTYAIGPGFVIPVGHNNSGSRSGVDFSFRYESASVHDLRQTALRIGYRFGW